MSTDHAHFSFTSNPGLLNPDNLFQSLLKMEVGSFGSENEVIKNWSEQHKEESSGEESARISQQQTVEMMQHSYPGSGSGLSSEPGSEPELNDAKELGLHCVHCGKMFTYQSDLKIHKKAVHDQIRDHVCEICAKGFLTSSALNMHKLTHTGEKKFPCHICGKAFRSKDYLIQHTRQHTGEKPHSCEICGKTFAYPSALSNHRKQHDENRGIACEVCGKIFKIKKNLKAHMVVHCNGETDSGKRIYSNDFKLEVLKKVQEIGISATAKLVRSVQIVNCWCEAWCPR